MSFFKKEPPPPQPKTLIGSKTALKGDLSSQEAVEIHGQSEGPVTTKKRLTVAPGGKASGKLTCADFSCRGEASGEALVTGLATFDEPGDWEGHLSAGALVIRPGTRVAGRISRK